MFLSVSAAPSTASVMPSPSLSVGATVMHVWKVVPSMTAVTAWVVLLVSAVGVPLMAHVLLSIDTPAGNAGETLHDAPVTASMKGARRVVEVSQVLAPVGGWATVRGLNAF